MNSILVPPLEFDLSPPTAVASSRPLSHLFLAFIMLLHNLLGDGMAWVDPMQREWLGNPTDLLNLAISRDQNSFMLEKSASSHLCVDRTLHGT